jgi:hypothetical protein
MTAGRPTLYNDDVQKKADEYLNNWEKTGDVIPSIAGLADYLGLAVRTMHLWKEKHEKFMHTLEKIQTKQHRVLLNNGLNNTFNSAIAKLALANHGYSEKTQTDLTSSDGSLSPVPVTFVTDFEKKKDG